MSKSCRMLHRMCFGHMESYNNLRPDINGLYKITKHNQKHTTQIKNMEGYIPHIFLHFYFSLVFMDFYMFIFSENIWN